MVTVFKMALDAVCGTDFIHDIWLHVPVDIQKSVEENKANRKSECARCVAYVPDQIWSRELKSHMVALL